ncbi:hypothetical protein N0V86_000687 [Didymella sp. IMI 355093]|nr:hypothetical protein N0V86_000687 [Didymella sp. IMI 355093]
MLSGWKRTPLATQAMIEEAKKQQTSSEPSQEQKLVDNPGVSHNQDNKTDAQDWDIVKDSEDELKLEPKPRIDGVSSQFNFQVGWGKWKWDLFNWDVNVGKVARRPEEASPLSPSSMRDRNKEAQLAERS